MKHKDNILKLREQGYSYREIEKTLGCSKSTISFHLGKGQKEKNNTRSKKCKDENPLIMKISNFKTRKRISDAKHDFKKRGVDEDKPFTVDDVLKKIGENPRCYLSGRPIDLEDPTSYSFDHIISVYNGGSNSLDNLEICHPNVNVAKGYLHVHELIEMCKEILIYNGFTVSK